MTGHTIKHYHKPTATPPSTVISTTDNQFLLPSDNDDDNDANPVELMGKYDVRGKKKGKGGHHRRYREDYNIKALNRKYEKPKDKNEDVRDNGYGDWDYMEEKAREEDDDKDDDVFNITAVQCFGMPDKAFLSNGTKNRKKKKEDEEEKRKVEEDDGR